MRRQPVVEGHPLHAMASDLPAALVPAAFGTALLERIRPSWVPQGTVRCLVCLAFGGGATAALTGWWDWLKMPKAHPAWKPGTVHGMINSGSLLLVVGAFLVPDRRLELLAGATAGTFVAAWLGGEMVFHHGWRVRPAEEFEIVVEALGETRAEFVQKAEREVDRYEREETFQVKRRSTEGADEKPSH